MDLNQNQRLKLLDRVLQFFLHWCRTEMKTILYDYQVRVARAALATLIVEPKTLAIKIARQAGKTEVLTLLLKFLIIYHLPLFKRPLMSAIASPQGEQAKTDIDRIKKSIAQLRERWGLEDKENNASTIRAYRNGKLTCEMFRFSLAPTTHNESKTLNLLVIEESHLIDDRKRSEELDPMLVSTGGPTWMVGVGCTRLCDFKKACDGLLANSEAIVVDAEEVIRDRRKVYEETGDPSHLQYEHAFTSELRKKGKQNPEIRRNYYLEDTVEAGNFISRERLLGCARPQWQRKNGILIPIEDLTFSLDWARRVDSTWAGVTTRQFDLLDMWKIPHVRYEEQMGLLMEELKKPRTALARLPDGTEKEITFTWFEKITTVRCDSTGPGDFPTEYLRDHSGLPMGDESQVQFTNQSKNEMYTVFEAALYREPGDPLKYSYPSDHPLTAEFEEQMTILLREYKGNGEYLSPHAPEEPGAHDDAPTMGALGCLGAATGKLGSILMI